MKIETREEYEREYNILRDVFKDSNALLNKNLLILDNSFIKSLERKNFSLEEQNQGLQSLLDFKQQEISVLESQIKQMLKTNFGVEL